MYKSRQPISSKLLFSKRPLTRSPSQGYIALRAPTAAGSFVRFRTSFVLQTSSAVFPGGIATAPRILMDIRPPGPPYAVPQPVCHVPRAIEPWVKFFAQPVATSSGPRILRFHRCGRFLLVRGAGSGSRVACMTSVTAGYRRRSDVSPTGPAAAADCSCCRARKRAATQRMVCWLVGQGFLPPGSGA